MIQHTIQLDSAPVRTDAGHRGAGGAERAGEEGAAAVPVRPPALRVQGRQLEAELAKAKQDVLVLKADIGGIDAQKVVKLKSELEYAHYQQKLSTDLAGRAPVRRKTRRSGPRKSPPTRPASRRRRPRMCARELRYTVRDQRREHDASPPSRPSSTRRAFTSTTP